MSYPLVSVLVRSVDRPSLPRTLESIAAQRWPHLEIVVVAANGAGHRPFPGTYRGRLLRLIVPPKPLERAAAANLALDNARGDLLNFLDDDDEFLPHHIDTLAGVLMRRGDIGLAFGRQRVIDAAGRDVGCFGEAWSRAALFEHPCFGMAAALFRRALLRHGVRFDTALAIGEDHDFWMQCARHAAFMSVEHDTSRWHAFIGTSGGGAGDNHDESLKRRAAAYLRRKWRSERRAWLATPRGCLERLQYALGHLPPRRMLLLAGRVVQRFPADPNALHLAAMAHHFSGDSATAAVLLGRALEVAPGHAKLLSNLKIVLATINR